MAAKLTRQTHKIAIQLHLVVESSITYSSRSRRPVLKFLDTPSYTGTQYSLIPMKTINPYFQICTFACFITPHC
jgi:hypothetical protein